MVALGGRGPRPGPRSYSGPDHGVGSAYHWAGNKKAGEGEMAITGVHPDAVVVDLDFLKPFKATNVTTFDLAPAAATPPTSSGR